VLPPVSPARSMITDRMLGMFARKPKPSASSASRPGADGSEGG
jgi:hypothetical protein